MKKAGLSMANDDGPGESDSGKPPSGASPDPESTQPGDPDATRARGGDEAPGDKTIPGGGASETIVAGGTQGSAAPGLPAQIGEYRIIRLLGSGGMGSVYEAEQARPLRRVALKVIRPGYVSEALLRRFDREADALGRLQHPGIAHIYEAGTATTGTETQPFFAMELVRGVSLNQYADDKNLSASERLALVAKVCEAVQYAHQQGVIHRDLKPGNILVDETGQPKILDFGVARITETDVQASTVETEIGQIVGTRPYMSPEQARGDPKALDTRSDIYALGVIAYELLAHRLPFDLEKVMLYEAVRVICEDDPAPLSSIDRRLRGDIETIISKAMSKEKTLRYQSASELAADLNRYLADQPISARPPSTWYQVSKFAKRHKVLVSAAAAVVVALVLGVIGTSVGMIRAQTAEGIARVEEKRARKAEATAVTERNRAEIARNEEAEQRKRAVAALGEARHQLAQNLLGRANDASGLYVAARRSTDPSGSNKRAADMRLAAAYQFIPPALNLLQDPAQRDDSGFPVRVLCLAVTPDGRHAITGDELGSLRVWDVPTGRLMKTIKAHESPVKSVAITPDGAAAISSGGIDRARVSGGGPHSNMFKERSDLNLRTWNLATGEQTHVLKGSTGQVALSMDGKLAASSNWEDGIVRVWDIAAEREVVGLNIGASGAVTISPDGKSVAAARRHIFGVWDIATGKLRRESPDVNGHEDFVVGLAFSPDGQRVLSGGDHTIRIWDLANQSDFPCLDTFDHGAAVAGVAFSPDGQEVFSLDSGGRIECWALRAGGPGRHVRTRQCDAPEVRVSAIAPGAQLVLAGVSTSVRVCDMSEGMETGELRGHQGLVRTILVSQDGRMALSGGDDKALVLWDLATRKQLWRRNLLADSVAMAYSPDERQVVVAMADRKVDLIDVVNGKSLLSTDLSDEAATGVAFSPDGRVVAAGSAGRITLWESQTGKILWRWTNADMLGVRTILRPGVGFTPDGQQVFALSRQGYAKMWKVDGGSIIVTSSHLNKFGEIGSTAFFRDGVRALSATHDLHALKVWNFQTGIAERSFERPAAARAVRLSRDEVVAFTAGFDGVLTLWDSATGREIVRWLGHDGSALKLLPGGDSTQTLSSIVDASVSGDGSVVVTSGCDKMLKLWDLSRSVRYGELLPQLDGARNALQSDPENGEALAAMGEWYAFRGRWVWARQKIEDARRKGVVGASLALARSRWLLGDHAGASDEFRVAGAANEAPSQYLRICREAAAAGSVRE